MAFGKRKTPPSGASGGMAATVAGARAAGDPAVVKRTDGHEGTLTPRLPTEPSVALRPPGFGPDFQTDHVTPLAGALFAKFCDAYRDERGVHIETIMAAIAALTGEFALRAGAEANGHKLPTGRTYVVGGLADPYLYGGDTDGQSFNILGLLNHLAVAAGADAKRLADPRAIVRTAVAAIAEGKPYPPRPSVPERHLPLEWSPNACPRHRSMVIAAAATHGVFEPDEITAALGMAMALVLRASQDSTPPLVAADVMVTLAAEVMIAVARMAPLDGEIG